jgi:predicted MFS family arabinose efflux permease
VKRNDLAMHSIAPAPGARRLLSLSIVARLPLAALSIALLVHTERVTGSFASAGLVTAAYAVALAVGGPVLGGLADRRGQTGVLLGSAAVAAALLVATGLLPGGIPLAVPVALATGIGLATPPIGACLRAVLPSLLADRDALRRAYGVEASASELTWVFGPPLALAAGAMWSTGAALAAAGLVLFAATAAFAAEPASRGARPGPATARPRGGALHLPAMRTLVFVMGAVGVLFGAVEVAVTAAAETLDDAAAAAPLLGLWGAGSLAGGVVATRLGAALEGATGLVLMLVALAAGHLALVLAAGSLAGIGAVLLVAGAAIAPTYATVHAMVDEAAPASTVTEAFAWLATAAALGAAVGAATGGAIADHAGPAATFAFAGAAGLLAWLTAAVRSATLAPALAPGLAAG